MRDDHTDETWSAFVEHQRAMLEARNAYMKASGPYKEAAAEYNKAAVKTIEWLASLSSGGEEFDRDDDVQSTREAAALLGLDYDTSPELADHRNLQAQRRRSAQQQNSSLN